MRRSTLVMCVLLLTATFGCDRVKPELGRVASIGATVKHKFEQLRDRLLHRKPAATPGPLAAAPGGSTAATPGAAEPPPPPPSPPPAPPRHPSRPATPRSPAGRPAAVRDVPYVSPDTGTIAPGMGERDVYALWGPPVAVRHLGEYTYLFFPNGCEYTCGTMDVVTLKDGHVVDAILRWPGHGYSGQSSSPAAMPPHGPPPGADTLRVAPPNP
jgi:hypothetical protein